MKETLVLLPGMMCDARLFAPQIVALSGDRAVHLAPVTGADTVEKIAGQVLTRAPDRFALAGHALGGVIAMEILRRAPERVSRIALLSTSAQAEPPGIAAERETQIVLAKSGKLADAIRNDINKDDLADGPHRDEIFAMLLRMADDLGPEVYINQCRAMQRRPDQQKTMRKLKIPTLIMCGDQDGLTPPKRHEFLATLVRDARLEIVPAAGHLPSLEQPESTTTALKTWLDAPMMLR